MGAQRVRGGRVHAGLVLLLLLAEMVFASFAGTAFAAPAVSVRRGEHPGFSRVVFVLPGAVRFSFDRVGAEVRLNFPGVGAVPGSAPDGRVAGIRGGVDGATVTLAAGKFCRVWQLGNRVVVDIRDTPLEPTGPGGVPAAAARRAGAAGPAPPALAQARPAAVRVPLQPVSPMTIPAMPAAAAPAAQVLVEPVAAVPLHVVPSAPQPANASPGPQAAEPAVPVVEATAAAPNPGPAAGPTSFEVTLLPPDGDWPKGAVLFPFGADVGAAAFRRGGEGHVVFDTAQAIDLGPLRNDPTYGGMAVSLLPDGTHLHLALPAASRLRLDHAKEGWRVGIVSAASAGAAITAHAEAGVLSLTAAAPGRVVLLPDQIGGGRLMAATQRDHGASWQAPYVTAEFALLPTWQGILVQPVSDRAVIHQARTGFTVGADDLPPLAMPPKREAAPDPTGAAALTRRFDFMPVPTLMWRDRLQQASRDAAAAPKLGRFGPRLRVAQAMMALGMSGEAAAVLKTARSDDPGRAGEADMLALSAMADWLAGRSTPAELAGLNDPALSGTDEMTLWRAVLPGPGADAAAPAGALASIWKLAVSYPDSLRVALLPAMADIMARGGQPAALRAMLQAAPDAALEPARAALLAADGKTDLALAAYGRLANGADRLQSSRARRASTELLLATHRIDGHAAAEQLGQQLFAWRGGPQELELRMRLAALQGQNVDWRAGLALLRSTEPLYPDKHDALRAAQRSLVADLVRGSAADRMTPLDLVAVAEECADLLAENGADAKLAPVLADKLMALDLPERAEPVLQRIMDHAANPVLKADLGLRLAELRLDLHGARAALDTLDASSGADLPASLAGERLIVRARALTASGDGDGALRLLAAEVSPPALELRTKLLEQKHAWGEAEAALAAEAKLVVPPAGPLDANQQNLLLHLASLAAQADDQAMLQKMQAEQATRIDSGPRLELFRLLTDKPVKAVADISRSGRELVSARGAPAAIANLRNASLRNASLHNR